MAIDPRRLRPSELCRLLNSTPLGEVINERQLHRHRVRAGKRAVRHVVFDTNYWKSFIHTRLAVAMGDHGCLSLFGDRAEQHRLFAEHITAEYRVKTTGRGRTVDEWKDRPEHGDNHWFDCLVGCAVAASIQGVALPTMPVEVVRTRKRVSFAEMQDKRRRGK